MASSGGVETSAALEFKSPPQKEEVNGKSPFFIFICPEFLKGNRGL
jgi:hypothetical protein